MDVYVVIEVDGYEADCVGIVYVGQPIRHAV